MPADHKKRQKSHFEEDQAKLDFRSWYIYAAMGLLDFPDLSFSSPMHDIILFSIYACWCLWECDSICSLYCLRDELNF